MYESHMGGIYFSDSEIDIDDLYCETCGDSDWPLGEAGSFADAWEALRDYCSFFGSGGFTLQYIFPALLSAFPDDIPLSIHAKNVFIEDNGCCDLDDLTIVSYMGEILGKPISVYKCTHEGSCYVLADSETEAKEKGAEILDYRGNLTPDDLQVRKATIEELRGRQEETFDLRACE